MALVSPLVAAPRARVLQGTLVLVLLLALGPIVSWKLCLLVWPMRWTILATVAFAELCFYRCWYLPAYKEHNRIPQPCRPRGFTDADGRRMWRRFIALAEALPGGVDPQEYLSQWFCNAPFEAIKRGNVQEMLTYGFFYKRIDELGPDMRHFPSQMVSDLEKALKVKFAPGYTPRLKFMSHLWDQLRANYRPLGLYVVMECLYFAQRLIMAGYGFNHRVRGQLGYYTLKCGLDAATYSKHANSTSGSSSSSPRSRLDRFFDTLSGWIQGEAGDDAAAAQRASSVASLAAAASDANSIDYTPFADPAAAAAADDEGSGGGAGPGGRGGAEAARPPKNPLQEALPEGDTPVMFLHGVGGLMLYLEMLKHVIALGHPVIVIEYKHVGMRLSSYIPSVDELTRNVADILEFEGIPKVCVVGHSYGSFVASRLNMTHREKVHSMCVIDPVALGMFMPHLLHNFMYRRPRVDLKRPDILIRDLVLWFASRDVHLSATFSRSFYWTEMNMWPDDLPAGSCIILSGNDDLCNAEGVESMCKLSGHVKVIVNPDLFHGAFLLSHNHKANLMREVRNLLATSGSLVVHMARPVLAQTISAARSLLHEVETLTSRLSMSPQPFSPAGGAGGLEGRPSSRLWSRMSQGLAGSLSKKTSVPAAPSSPCPSEGSRHGAVTPARSPSAPLTPAATADIQLTPAAATAGGSGEAGAGGDPAELAPAVAGWWGAAAAAAAAACNQQPAAVGEGQQGARSSRQQQHQQQHQLSVIMSGPEVSLAQLPDAATADSGVKVSAHSSMSGEGDDWVITDQDACAGSGGGSAAAEGLLLLNPADPSSSSKKSLGPIHEHTEKQ